MWTSKSFVCKTLKLLKDLSLKPSLGYAVIFFHHSSLSQLGYHKYLVDHQTNNAYRWKKEVPTLCKWAPKKTVFEIFLPSDTKIWFAYCWTGDNKACYHFYNEIWNENWRISYITIACHHQEKSFDQNDKTSQLLAFYQSHHLL